MVVTGRLHTRRCFSVYMAALLWVGVPAWAVPFITTVTIDDINNALPSQFGDLNSINWRVLEQTSGGAVSAPNTPTGVTNEVIRLFTNGNTNQGMDLEAVGVTESTVWDPDSNTVGQATQPPNYKDTFNVNDFDANGRPIGSSELYFGLEFEGQGQTTPTVQDATTVGSIVQFIQTGAELDPTDPVTPIFGFDQNQEGGTNIVFDNPDPIPDILQQDILLRGRQFLINPALIPTDGTLTPDQVDQVILNAAPSEIREFLFLDDPGGDPVFFPGGNFPHDDAVFDDVFFDPDEDTLPYEGEDDDQWVFLPGVFDPDGPGPIVPVDNNGDAAHVDWGGYLIDSQTGMPVNLLSVNADDGVTPVGLDWLWVTELQAALDNNGKEEAYLLGALVQEEPPGDDDGGAEIPEPLTAGLAWLGLAGLGLQLRRRA